MRKIFAVAALVALAGVVGSSIRLQQEMGKTARLASGPAEQAASVPEAPVSAPSAAGLEPGTEIDVRGKVLADAISGSLGRNLRCDFATDVGENRSVGVLYVAGDNRRIDARFDSPHASEEDFDMIWNKQGGYAWGPAYLGGAGRGVRFTYQESADAAAAQSGQISYEEPISRCVVWEADAAQFALPPEVVFMTRDELSDYLIQNPEGHSCGLCDYFDPAAKVRCLESYGCPRR